MTKTARVRLWPDPAPEGLPFPRSSAWRLAAGQAVAWFGLIVPPAVVEVRPPSAVAADPLTVVTLFRGLAPVLCLVIAMLFIRPALRPVGVREWSLALYLLVAVVSATWSLDPRTTLLKAGHLAAAYGLLVLIARQWSSMREELRDLTAVVYGVVLLAVVAALLRPSDAFDAEDGRLLSQFPALQPVVLGLFAALAVVLACAWLTARPSAPALLLHSIVLATATVVLLLTASRTATTVAVVGAVALVVLKSRGHRFWRARALGLLLVPLTLTLSPLGEGLRVRFASAWRDAGTFSGRVPMWEFAFELVQTRPLTGFGYYAGHRVGPYADWFRANVNQIAPAYIDGTWAETLLDLGLLGLLSLLAFVVCCLAVVLRSGGFRSPVYLVLVVVMLGWSIQDYTLQQVGYPMIVLAGLLLVPTAPAPPVVPEPGQRRVSCAER